MSEVDRSRFVPIELFEAANTHVLEQGIYVNQVIGTLNKVGAERKAYRLRCEDLERRAGEMEQEIRRLNAELSRVRGLVRELML